MDRSNAKRMLILIDWLNEHENKLPELVNGVNELRWGWKRCFFILLKKHPPPTSLKLTLDLQRITVNILKEATVFA